MRLALLSILLFVSPASAAPHLTDRGRDEARAIGEHVKRLKIPIGEVLASPFCRTMETARLAFSKAGATGDVRGGPVEASRYAALRKLLSAMRLPAHPTSPKARWR